MGTASVHEGVRRMRFESLLGRQERGEITQIEAAEMLGVSVRTFQRWAGRFDETGADGLADRRLGRPSPRRASQEEVERMLGLYRMGWPGTVSMALRLRQRRGWHRARRGQGMACRGRSEP